MRGTCYGAALAGTEREDATDGRARRRTRRGHTRRRTDQARGRCEPAAGACARPFCYGRRGRCRAVVGRAFSERGLDVDTWEATREETEPYREHVGEQSSYENRPNIADTRRGAGNGRSILLNAHTDTVDPGDPTAWKGDPLSGNLEGDLLYGRGSCDMKGGLVTHLVALDVLSDLGLGLRGDVTVAATVGEENGGLGALSTVLRGYS